VPRRWNVPEANSFTVRFTGLVTMAAEVCNRHFTADRVDGVAPPGLD